MNTMTCIGILGKVIRYLIATINWLKSLGHSVTFKIPNDPSKYGKLADKKNLGVFRVWSIMGF